MTLRLPLTPDLEQRLTKAAEQSALGVEALALQILDANLPQQDGRSQAVALLQSWIDDPNTGEQQETGDFLIRALDEDRLSNRKLFPPELKGVTW